MDTTLVYIFAGALALVAALAVYCALAFPD